MSLKNWIMGIATVATMTGTVKAETKSASDGVKTEVVAPDYSQELKSLDEDIRRLTKESMTEADLQRSLLLQEEVQKLSKVRTQKRNQLFTLQDELDQRRAELIAKLKARLSAVCNIDDLFLFKWRLA